MKSFFAELKKRNITLYYFGWLMFIGFFVCFILSWFDKTIILGISAWIKPMKFYVSIGIMSWTISWLAYDLANQKKVIIYSWVVVVTMVIEMIIISFQSARGQQSHFNVSTPFNGILFSIMGVSITIFTLWTAYICLLFFSAERIQYFQNIFVVNKAWVNTFYIIRTRRLGNGWQTKPHNRRCRWLTGIALCKLE